MEGRRFAPVEDGEKEGQGLSSTVGVAWAQCVSAKQGMGHLGGVLPRQLLHKISLSPRNSNNRDYLHILQAREAEDKWPP